MHVVGVVARAVPSERLDLGRVGDLTITSRNGVAVPLQQIAKIEYAHEEPILWRRNRDMAITVRSDVVDGVQAPDVTNQIAPKLRDIQAHLEPAYRIEPGGAFTSICKAAALLKVCGPPNRPDCLPSFSRSSGLVPLSQIVGEDGAALTRRSFSKRHALEPGMPQSLNRSPLIFSPLPPAK